jgi:ATP-binding cassette, subfamily C (CFTR/MRP), member 1
LLASDRQSAWIGLGALQLVSLILWTSPAAARTQTSLAAAAIALLASLALCLLSYVEHDRTVRPSTFLAIVLFVTLLFDIARARTLWLRQNGDVNLAIAEVFTASVVVKALVLVLEATRKRPLLRPEYQAYPPEATAGIYARSFFTWLNSLIRRGFSQILGIDDLFELDKHLKTSYLQQNFQSAWNKGKPSYPSSSSQSAREEKERKAWQRSKSCRRSLSLSIDDTSSPPRGHFLADQRGAIAPTNSAPEGHIPLFTACYVI